MDEETQAAIDTVQAGVDDLHMEMLGRLDQVGQRLAELDVRVQALENPPEEPAE